MPQINVEKLWARCLDIVKANVSEQDYQTWFLPIVLIGMNEERKELQLRVPSRYFYEYIDSKFKNVLYAIVFKVFKSKEIRIIYNYIVDSTNNAIGSDEGHTSTAPGQKVNQRTKVVQQVKEEFDSRLNETYTFENFIEGESNILLRSVGLSIADSPKVQTTFNPLFIYGNSGVGKTHLVQAIGIRYKRNHPGKRVLYVSAHEFKVQFTTAVSKTNSVNDFILFYQTIDLLIIDDVHDLAGNNGTLNALFNIFQHLKMNGKLIIFTCDRAPSSLPGIENRLVTRFKWGLAEELKQPSQELCQKILESKVHNEHLNIPDNVIRYVVSYANDNVRELEGVLNSLIAHSVVYNRDIDIELARQVVQRTIQSQHKSVTIDEILRITCEAFDVTQEDVLSKTRKAPIVLVRQLCMYLAHKYTQLTTTKIGLYIGQRNHATVIHSIEQINNMLATNKEFAAKVQEIEAQLKR